MKCPANSSIGIKPRTFTSLLKIQSALCHTCRSLWTQATMNSAYVGLLAVAFYALSFYSQLRWFAQNGKPSHETSVAKATLMAAPALAISIVAMVIHGVYVTFKIQTDSGIDLSFFNVGVLVSLTINTAFLIASIRQPVHNLFLIVFSIAIVTIVGSILVDRTATPRTNISPGLLAHILMSIIAYSILTLTACQAAILLIFDSRLRQHISLRFIRLLPPLETMEALLFQWLSTGLLLLTIAITSGFIFLYDQFSEHVTQHHTVLSLASWIVYMALLLGNYLFGWRGSTISRWVLVAFALLMIGYFGTKFVIEFVLDRG